MGRRATVVSLLTWIVVYAHERAPVWYALLYPLGSAVVAFIMFALGLARPATDRMARTHLHELEVDAEHERHIDPLDDGSVLLEVTAAEARSGFAVFVCDGGGRVAS